MRFYTLLLLFLITFFKQSQEVERQNNILKFKECKTINCQIHYSFQLAEFFLENDHLEESQKWLNITKSLSNPKTIDSTACFINSIQSEIFYYNRLFQFGKQEANKGILKSKKLKDSLFISDAYFFLGINQFELKEYNLAIKSFLNSKKYFPKLKFKKHIRNTIQNEHIYNNIAQSKLKNKELDSAIWYNKNANIYAKQNKSIRGIPNSEQTFGEIYLQKKQLDSASFYFNKSLISAQKSNYYDIMLLNSAFLMKCNPSNTEEIQKWFDFGLELEKNHLINDGYKKHFFEIALEIFSSLKNTKNIILIQQKIITIDSKTRERSDFYIQNFTNNQITNESKLLTFEINELKKKQNITFLQLIVSILIALLFLMFIFIVRRKNRITKTLLDQKNEISKDLHDDIGSGLSSILIYADLLSKNPQVSEKEKILATKISLTGKEISQRLNTFIWSLNAEHNNLQHFLEYLKQYASNLFEGTEIQFNFIDKTNLPIDIELNGKVRKNLFLCVKEILNNSIKYANASVIEILIEKQDKNKLIIEIRDNGTGIEKDNFYGNGLKNIQKRVDELNGNLIIKNDKGLVTQISIPIVF